MVESGGGESIMERNHTLFKWDPLDIVLKAERTIIVAVHLKSFYCNNTLKDKQEKEKTFELNTINKIIEFQELPHFKCIRQIDNVRSSLHSIEQEYEYKFTRRKSLVD